MLFEEPFSESGGTAGHRSEVVLASGCTARAEACTTPPPEATRTGRPPQPTTITIRMVIEVSTEQLRPRSVDDEPASSLDDLVADVALDALANSTATSRFSATQPDGVADESQLDDFVRHGKPENTM
jgi:hypothetical protein